MDKYLPVTCSCVNITDGFWKNRIELNQDVTIYSVMERFKETGRFEAFRFNWTEGSDLPKPHIFWDSDVAKWMESVALIIEKKDNPELRKEVEDLITLMEINQQDDGYFNIAHTVVFPEKRFKIRDNHELYCLGHFIEAAVAWKAATGSDRLIKICDRYIDLVIKVFTADASADFVTPGHEEIELALVKLYRCTGNKKYLDLAVFFINERGIREEYLPDWCNSSYNQSQLPVRQQKEAMGHAVRACYLYSAMADIAKEIDDNELFDACKAIFDDIVNKKMYITGGIGSSHHGEAFTVAYDLPGDTAYAETCASIGLMMFADRMKDIELDSKYADIVEKEIYNGIISGISLDGKAFFYENPLEVNLIDRKRHTSLKNPDVRLPITRRQEVFGCSCCPPNLTRFFASVANNVFSQDESRIVVHQFMSCTAEFNNMNIIMTTDYPADGKVSISVHNAKGKTLLVRIPGWCKNYSFSKSFIVKHGYAEMQVDSDEFNLVINFVMVPEFIRGNPSVRHLSGKAAVMYGPIVYCVEKCDNPDIEHFQIRLDESSVPTAIYDADYCCNVLSAEVYVPKKTDDLYYISEDFKEEKKYVKMIPYFAFANRTECDMAVWLRI